MKRFVVALAVLLGVYGLARADYVIIIYNLGVTKDKDDGTGGQPGFPGFPGFPGGMGGMVPPGGVGGVGGMVPPGGVGGMVPPGGVGGGALGALGGAGGVPPGGALGLGAQGGAGGIPPGGMGGMQPPGGFGGMPFPPGGFGGGRPFPPGGMGGMGMGGMGGMGMGGMGMGGMGGKGIGGGMGMMGMGGFPGGGNIGIPDQNFTPLLAVAVVEVEHMKSLAGGAVHVKHKWSGTGSSYVLPVTSDKRITAVLLRLPTVHQRFEELRKTAYKNNKPTADGLLDLAEWSLKHGLLDKFVETMDKLATIDPKNEAVVAYQQVQKDMARPITKADASETWKAKVLDTYKVEKNEHYALLHNLSAATPAEVKSRLNRLEANYKAFFYWFALKGKVLKVPEERLVAVLVARGDEFKRQHQIFDSAPMVADGFLARRENLAVFSLARTDLASEALEKNTKSIWQDFTDRDSTLRRWPLKTLKNETLPLALGAEVQTIALLERALEEDSEIATVTHEGTRQLLAAVGFLPRGVAAPEWLQFGWASFFETPKGAPWMTVGTPSATLLPEFNYLMHYKAAAKMGKLEKQRHVTLEKVVTDAYFRDFAKNPKSDEARIKARTLAWSLMYFLANEPTGKCRDGLFRYQEELKKLPRDLEFDGDTLLLTFARAFDCLDASKPNTMDRAKLAKLADNWHAYVNQTPTEGEELFTELAKAQAELKGSTNPPKPGEGTKPSPPAGGGDGRK